MLVTTRGNNKQSGRSAKQQQKLYMYKGKYFVPDHVMAFSCLGFWHPIGYPIDPNPSHSFDIMDHHNANRTVIKYELLFID